MNPVSPTAYAGLGHIYFGMKKLKEAKVNFEKALTIEPKSATARFNLAMTCLAMNQKDCAREQYAILKHVEPDLSSQLLDQIYGSKVLRLVK
jgi:Tfp pilus assembly protein PilF